MTPKRKQALQWIFDVHHMGIYPGDLDYPGPSDRMYSWMMNDYQIYFYRNSCRLTEKGLRELHEATR